MNTSQNISGTFETVPAEWSALKLLFTLLFGAITITTIAGNLLVLYLFWKSKRSLRSPTHYLIANLSFADLQVGFGVMPILTSLTINDFKWLWGDLFCTLSEYSHFCLCAASMLSVMSIGIERYIAVRFPLRHKRILSRKRVLKIILLVWILAFTLTATPLTVWPTQEERQPYTCPVNLRSNFVFFISISVYFIPVFITTVAYVLIYKNAVKLYVPGQIGVQFSSTTSASTSYTSKSTVSVTSGKIVKSKSGMTDEERFLDTREKQAKLAKKLAYVVGGILIMYGPLFLIFLLKGFDSPIVTPYLLLTLGWIRYFSSCVNPFLYISIIPGFKKAFFKIVWNEKSRSNNTGTSTGTNSNTTTNNVKKDGNSSSGYNSGNSSAYPSMPIMNNITTVPSPRSPARAKSTRIDSSVIAKSNNLKSCTDCGNVVQFTNEQTGGGNLQMSCPICHQVSQVSNTDTRVITLSKPLTVTFVPQVQSSESIESAGRENEKSTLSSIYPDSLVNEIQSFLEAMDHEAASTNAKDKRGSIVRERASQLLNNLMTLSPPVETRNKRPSINLTEDMRKSVIMPLRERRSQLMNGGGSGENTNNSIEIDFDTMKALDDIIEQLEKAI